MFFLTAVNEVDKVANCCTSTPRKPSSAGLQIIALFGETISLWSGFTSGGFDS